MRAIILAAGRGLRLQQVDDVSRAAHEVLPQVQPLSGAGQ
jgi:choline kinase